MSKDRKVRNFDFLKQTPPPLPSREEVIQKTAELTGQSVVGEELTPSVSAPIEVVSAPVEVVTVPVITTPISTPIITPVSAPSPPPVVVVEKVVEVPAEVVVVPTPIAATVEKEKKAIQKKVKTVEVPLAVAVPAEKSKVGRKALVDTRKPFTTTITVDNKKRLRQLCAEYDIAMSDVINEILSAHFDQRAPSF